MATPRVRPILAWLAGVALAASGQPPFAAARCPTWVGAAQIHRGLGATWSLPDSVQLLSLEEVPERGQILVVTATGFDEFNRGRSAVWFLPNGADSARVIATATSRGGEGQRIFSRTISCREAIAVQLSLWEDATFEVYDYEGRLLAGEPQREGPIHSEWCVLIGWAYDSPAPTGAQSPALYAIRGCAGAWARPLDCAAAGPDSGLGRLVRVGLSPLTVDVMPFEQDLRGLALAVAWFGDRRVICGY